MDYTNRSLDEFLLTKEDLDNPLRPNAQVHIQPLENNYEEEEMGRGNSSENPINLEEDENGRIGRKTSSQVKNKLK